MLFSRVCTIAAVKIKTSSLREELKVTDSVVLTQSSKTAALISRKLDLYFRTSGFVFLCKDPQKVSIPLVLPVVKKLFLTSSQCIRPIKRDTEYRSCQSGYNVWYSRKIKIWIVEDLSWGCTRCLVPLIATKIYLGYQKKKFFFESSLMNNKESSALAASKYHEDIMKLYLGAWWPHLINVHP